MDEKKRIIEVNFQDRSLVFDDLAEEKLILRTLKEGTLEYDKKIDVHYERPLLRVVREFAELLRKDIVDLESLRIGVGVVGILSRLQTALENS